MTPDPKSFDSVGSKQFHATVGLYLDRARQRPLKLRRHNRDYLTIVNPDNYVIIPIDEFQRIAAAAGLIPPMSAHRAKTLMG